MRITMKTISWIYWLLFLYICLTEAKNKSRRPLSPPYPPSTLMLKKFRPINHRLSMGNTIHIDNNRIHQRIPYNHVNHRFRQPTMYSILSTNLKNQMPIRASLNKRVILPPQRVPIKEFTSVHQGPEFRLEYKPEHRSELIILPQIHRETIDDDKGPIHTIPAPNLNPTGKLHNPAANTEATANHHPQSTPNYRTSNLQNPALVNPESAAIGDNSSQQLRRTAPSSSVSPQHQYEVTEGNDLALKQSQPVQSTIPQPQQELDITGTSPTLISPHQQFNGLISNYLMNPNMAIAKPNVESTQSGIPMQTNLYGSLYVGSPSAAIQIPYVQQQIPDLRMGHPTPAESSLSAAQFYEFLNNLSPEFAEQYMSGQQQILQQQLAQSHQPDAMLFSRPQMHSFNYNEQGNKLPQQQLEQQQLQQQQLQQQQLQQQQLQQQQLQQQQLQQQQLQQLQQQQLQQQQLQQQQQQQQQILFDQDYASEDTIENYKSDSTETERQSLVNVPGVEQSGNNQYGETDYQRNPTMIFDKMADNNIGAIQFYTILPNRDAAEKLAALAAAGNINSQLIGQLRKQQQKNAQEDTVIPHNHKNIVDDDTSEQQIDADQENYDQDESHFKDQQHRFEQNKIKDDEKLPLQITVPDDYIMNDDVDNNTREDNMDMEYGYEIEDGEIKDP